MKRNNDKIEETREICAAAENIDNWEENVAKWKYQKSNPNLTRHY